ncbi:MAG: hypothetical protein HZB55_22145 [Deltaproteobacteria bacterium]|nr:hypothetical protein [Deltaproteobacteria bacterium]
MGYLETAFAAVERMNQEMAPARPPYLDAHGDLVIPFGAPPEALWWMPEGGSLLATLVNLDADTDVCRRYLDPGRLEWLEERAAILEHDAGHSRRDAEREALRILVEKKSI